ncbi:hypothetical protein ACFV2Q_04090 [Streptomyces sp. NPDC059650]|uniref:hypothetical protein n=1 Tax=Streptomyces sp. NPDC059650 TaxID=3346896 RepID=UPI003688E695
MNPSIARPSSSSGCPVRGGAAPLVQVGEQFPVVLLEDAARDEVGGESSREAGGGCMGLEFGKGPAVFGPDVPDEELAVEDQACDRAGAAVESLPNVVDDESR